MLRFLSCWMLLFVAVAGFTGCADSATDTAGGDTETHDEHDGHDDHGDHSAPETFADAVAKLTAQQSTIKEAFTSGDMDAAHGPLHEIFDTIEALPGLAEKEGVSGDALEGIKTAKETLLDAFTKLDDVMHGGEEVKYEDVASDITTAMKDVAVGMMKK